jgi:hypothetical protein
MASSNNILNGIFRVLFLALTCLRTGSSGAQPLPTVIKTQALDMVRAVAARDAEKLAIYLPPKLVRDAGGMQGLLTARDTVNKYMKQFGAEIKQIVVGNPGKIISYKKTLQTTLPQTTVVRLMAGTATLESTLVAISEDQGIHWYFVDTSIYTGKKMTDALPELSPELAVPPMKPPIFKADP